MKRLIHLLLIVGVCILPLYANATIIGNTELTLSYSSPTGYVKFPGMSSYGNYYLDYDVKLGTETTTSEAFCVENADGATDGKSHTYTLLTIDSTLSNYGLDSARYLAAVSIAQYFYDNYLSSDTMKAAAQIAIWEVIFDGTDAFSLTGGTFASNAYTTYALAIWNAVKGNLLTSTEEWALAVSPTITEEDDVLVETYQNYLVRYDVPQVPEPASLLLFGFGLLGLAGIRSRMKK